MYVLPFSSLPLCINGRRRSQTSYLMKILSIIFNSIDNITCISAKGLIYHVIFPLIKRSKNHLIFIYKKKTITIIIKRYRSFTENL